MTPCVPSGWHQVGQDLHVSLPASHSKCLNVLGFLNRQQELMPFLFEGTCTAAVVKSCFESFCTPPGRALPTLVVLDNAPVHTAKLFGESIPDWQARHLFPDFLTSYSPELNLIEIRLPKNEILVVTKTGI